MTITETLELPSVDLASVDLSVRRPTVPPGAEVAVEQVMLSGRPLTRVTLGPIWQQSIHGLHVDRRHRTCAHRHSGVVITGRSRIIAVDGSEVVLHPGDEYEIEAGHDWRVERGESVVVQSTGPLTAACPQVESR